MGQVWVEEVGGSGVRGGGSGQVWVEEAGGQVWVEEVGGQVWVEEVGGQVWVEESEMGQERGGGKHYRSLQICNVYPHLSPVPSHFDVVKNAVCNFLIEQSLFDGIYRQIMIAQSENYKLHF